MIDCRVCEWFDYCEKQQDNLGESCPEYRAALGEHDEFNAMDARDSLYNVVDSISSTVTVTAWGDLV